MEVWIIIQVVVNLLFLGAGVVIWTKLSRPPQDDPRLNRGLQLLQSKIVVLEDLSDRTDRQFQQMTQLLEQKTKMIQEKILSAREQVEILEVSMQKSLEVADIFQDKIPHEEIIERQNTVKYVKAAQMAHRGQTVDQILEVVDLPREQIEFIAKVNREQLVFDTAQLPEWLNRALNRSAEPPSRLELEDEWLGQELATLSRPSETQESLRALGDRFREACEAFNEKEKKLTEPKPVGASRIGDAVAHVTKNMEKTVRKVVFPSI